MLDASPYYTILRYEEASLALRAALELQVVERLGNREVTLAEFQDEFQFTDQASQIFSTLLRLMEVLDRDGTGRFRVTERARICLADSSPNSRKPYLSMGAPDATLELIGLLQGNQPQGMPLYAGRDEASLMEAEETSEVAEAVALGLASRAKCFAPQLAQFIAEHNPAIRSFADIGAGSPYLAFQIAQAIPEIEKIQLVDQASGLKFAQHIAMQLTQDHSNTQKHLGKIQYCEQDFFVSVPPAACYCLSNTAHDWLPAEYAALVRNICLANETPPRIIVHEPLMIDRWETEKQWQQALWMTCYALTLFKLTHGQGTCYTLAQHDEILQSCGYQRTAEPKPTTDGCTALLYSPTS